MLCVFTNRCLKLVVISWLTTVVAAGKNSGCNGGEKQTGPALRSIAITPKQDSGFEVLVEVTRGEAFASSIEHLALSLQRLVEPVNDSPARIRVQRNGMVLFETETNLFQDDVALENVTAEVTVQEYGGQSHGPEEMLCSCSGICDQISVKNFSVLCLMLPNVSMIMNDSAVLNGTENASPTLEGDLPDFASAPTVHKAAGGHGKPEKSVRTINATRGARGVRPQRIVLPKGSRITTKKASVMSTRTTHVVVGVVSAILSMIGMAVCAFERRKVIVTFPKLKIETSPKNVDTVHQQSIGASQELVSLKSRSLSKGNVDDSDSESDFDYWA